MTRQRLIAIAVPAVLFVVTGAFIAALLSGHSTAESALGIGTITALAANLITALVKTVTASQDKAPPVTPPLPGLIRIRTKSGFDPEDWLQLLRMAKTEFYIAGHSLGRWCEASHRDEFKNHLQRILNGEGRVTLVTLAPGSAQIERLQQATSVNYTDRIHTSHAVLAELNASLEPTARERLRISVLADNPALPYMVVGNEQRLVTATYLASSDSDDVACLELERSTKAAAAVYDDFHKLAEAGEPATLPSIKPQSSAKPTPSWRRLLRRCGPVGAGDEPPTAA